jgi:hypothetical protein
MQASQLLPYRCIYHYHQVIFFSTRIYQDSGFEDPGQGSARAAQIIHGANRAPKGLLQGIAAAYGVGIGIPVAEVEDTTVFADAIAKLGLANVHERYSGVWELI